MITLYHHPFCPHSRFVRLVLAEMGIEPGLVEERAWGPATRVPLLLAPEGATPVMIEDDALSLPGTEVIAEYLDETLGSGLGERRLIRRTIRSRAPRRAVLTYWFNVKFFNEASQLAQVRGEDRQALHEVPLRAAGLRTWTPSALRALICAIICATSATSSRPATGWPAIG